MPNFW